MKQMYFSQSKSDFSYFNLKSSISINYFLCFFLIFGSTLKLAASNSNNNIIISNAINFTSSNLPVIVINTSGKTIPDPYRIFVDMGIIYNGEGVRNHINDPFNHYDGKINIEIRGSSSQYFFSKKQYAIETQDSSGSNLNISLLDMPAENDWVLYGPYSDKSLIRNVLVYKLWNEIGRYASRTRFCELVINDDYLGVYVLMEKVKRDKNRVNISRLNPDEISGDNLTGGYIFKIDKEAGESYGGWYSPFPPFPQARTRLFYQYHYPKPDEIVPDQEDYIQKYIFDFELMMYTRKFADPIYGYPKFIDIDSFVDYVLISEFSKNVDSYRLSLFMYKDKDSIDPKLFIGPIWDFNLAFGNADYYEGYETEGWQLDHLHANWSFKNNDRYQMPFWWYKLFHEPKFFNRLKSRWQKLGKTIFAPNSIFNTIDSLVVLLDESQQRNFQRWQILGKYIWPNAFIGQNYQEEVDYLKQWILDRIQWMDRTLLGSTAIESNRLWTLAPNDNSLSQNYPNPFNQITHIEYNLTKPGLVIITVNDVLGREIKTLVCEEQQPGHYRIDWNGTDNIGQSLSSGIYFYRLKMVSKEVHFSQVRKLILMK